MGKLKKIAITNYKGGHWRIRLSGGGEKTIEDCGKNDH